MKDVVRQKLDTIANEFDKKYPTLQEKKKLSFELGIDEAGRGPVFGPMIYAGLWWPQQLKEAMLKLGFDDSKKISEETRQLLFEQIKYISERVLFFQTKQLTAQYISNCMLGNPGKNLNVISHESAMQIIKSALDQGFNVKNIYVDTVGDANKYRQYLWANLGKYACIENIVVTPKADSLHKVVSAASICAKVTRDHILKNWKFAEGLQFKGQLGSGYTSDPKTIAWLQNNKDPIFGYPNIVRFSWSTVSNALQKVELVKQRTKQQEKLSQGLNWFYPQNSKNYKADLWEMMFK